MPWCPACDRFLSPASVLTDGSCPRCGRAVDPGHAHAPDAPGVPKPPAGDDVAADSANGTEEEPLDPIPWHFKLLLGAVALYLGYRAFQGIEWLAGL